MSLTSKDKLPVGLLYITQARSGKRIRTYLEKAGETDDSFRQQAFQNIHTLGSVHSLTRPQK